MKRVYSCNYRFMVYLLDHSPIGYNGSIHLTYYSADQDTDSVYLTHKHHVSYTHDIRLGMGESICSADGIEISPTIDIRRGLQSACNLQSARTAIISLLS